MLMSAYRGYRGPRRKFRPQQPRLFPLFLFLSFFLSSSLLPPCSHSSSSRSDKLALLFRVREKIHSFHQVRVMKETIREGPARRQSYIPAVHPDRIPDVNTYDRRKVQTSMPRPSIRSFCRELLC